MRQVLVHPYELVPRWSLNAVAGVTARKGALLKVTEDDGLTGFSDLHPWPELNDLPLNEHLNALRAGKTTPLIERSLRLAHRDARARSAGKNLVHDQPLVKNNAIISDIANATSEFLSSLKHDGFESVKVKAGKDLGGEKVVIEELAEQDLRIRLDFNATTTAASVEGFWKSLSEKAKSRVEYIEDPCPYDFQTWTELHRQMPLAIDGELERFMPAPDMKPPFKQLVLKPAKVNVDDYVELATKHSLKITVTSYMDHVIGTLHALSIAQELKKDLGDMVSDAGCLTHTLFERDAFNTELTVTGPVLKPTHGFGVGFDHILRELSWHTP